MFDRLRNAWRGLRNDLPKRVEYKEVQVAVFGEPVRATLYQACKRGGHFGDVYVTYGIAVDYMELPPEYDYYQTCEQAHAAAEGGTVRKVDVLRVGGKYFVADRLQEVRVGPKPKKPKGKR